MKILSADQIRQWDAYTIANEPISSIDLMERASLQCSLWIESKNFTDSKFRIFCGKGNNGGDGLAIARQLSAKGFPIDVYILEAGSPGTGNFQANLSRLHSHPVQIHFVQHPGSFPAINKKDVVVDALFGSGLNRNLDGLAAELVNHINKSGATTISIDLPSGMFTDKPSSSILIKASYTLTFQLLKLCFLFPENHEFLGEVAILDIGLHPAYLADIDSNYELTNATLIKTIYKPRKKFSHKGTFGHALVVAGEKGKMGAAILCSRSCLRSGTGLVTSMVPGEQFSIIQTALPEAMAMAHEEIEAVDWSKYNSIGIGPGLGTHENGARPLQHVVSYFSKPIVIDADGLNILAANKELLKELPPGSILSPHPKEFERLFGKTANHLKRIQTARMFAKKLFVYIILKGHYSVLACPDGQVYFNSTGNSGMATGGSGDVLTGILTGLLAQGYSSKEACLAGMFLHGLAADIAVESVSQEAPIAGDITDYLGKAFLSISS